MTDTQNNPNLNSSKAIFVSKNVKITLMKNCTLKHNNRTYQGGTTLEVSPKEADYLIDNYFAVKGTTLPPGGMIIPEIHAPKARDDSDRLR